MEPPKATEPLAATKVRAAGAVTLNKQKYACVSTRFPAVVERVDAFEGDRVREGQSLAALYSADYLATQQDLIQLLRQADRDDRGTDADPAGPGHLARLLVSPLDRGARSGGEVRAVDVRSTAVMEKR